MNAQNRSSNSVKVIYLDPKVVKEAVEHYIQELCLEHNEIIRIIWFGSWINGIPTPYSDVDLSIIISHSDKSRRDRVPDYLPLGFPTGVDIFVFTESEFDELENNSHGFYEVIISGKEIFSRS